jgi:hypothetical protein
LADDEKISLVYGGCKKTYGYEVNYEKNYLFVKSGRCSIGKTLSENTTSSRTNDSLGSLGNQKGFSFLQKF